MHNFMCRIWSRPKHPKPEVSIAIFDQSFDSSPNGSQINLVQCCFPWQLSEDKTSAETRYIGLLAIQDQVTGTRCECYRSHVHKEQPELYKRQRCAAYHDHITGGSPSLVFTECTWRHDNEVKKMLEQYTEYKLQGRCNPNNTFYWKINMQYFIGITNYSLKTII